jgi:hypothetical protein
MTPGFPQAIVEVERGVFSATAAPVFLLDQQATELGLRAVLGAGESGRV